ncbi:EpsG family protein, partial [Vibrio paracholerae]|uniref:EpsG family protein n=1 Tax=Vibrio paracholerae TaxID=650003 RepID=UPI0011BF52AF
MENIAEWHSLIILFFALILIVSSIVKEINLVYYFLVFLFFCFFVFIGLRDVNSGSDTITYINYYNQSLGGEKLFEPVFELIINFSRFIGLSDHQFILFIFIITFSFLFFSALSYENMFVAPVFIVFFISTVTGFDLLINAIRNGLSISICTFAVLKYKRLRFYGYFLFIIFASFIHTSAFVFLLFPFVKKFLDSEYYVKFSFCVFFSCFLLSYIGVVEKILSFSAIDNIYIY